MSLRQIFCMYFHTYKMNAQGPPLGSGSYGPRFKFVGEKPKALPRKTTTLKCPHWGHNSLITQCRAMSPGGAQIHCQFNSVFVVWYLTKTVLPTAGLCPQVGHILFLPTVRLCPQLGQILFLHLFSSQNNFNPLGA